MKSILGKMFGSKPAAKPAPSPKEKTSFAPNATKKPQPAAVKPAPAPAPPIREVEDLTKAFGAPAVSRDAAVVRREVRLPSRVNAPPAPRRNPFGPPVKKDEFELKPAELIPEDEDDVPGMPMPEEPPSTSLVPNPPVPSPLGPIPRASDMTSKYIQADEGQIEDFLNWKGEVLTVPGGPVSLTAAQRQYCVMLANGSFLFLKSDPFHARIGEARQQIELAGRVITQNYLVEREVIRKIQEAAERRRPSGGNRGPGGLQARQAEFLKLVKAAAERKASDIHVIVERYEAYIRLRADGVMTFYDEMSADDAEALCAAAFNMADASDSNYKPMEYQGARVSETKSPLPEGVQSIRLQFNPLPAGGRYMVCRLLYASSGASSGGDVDTLGYNQVHIDQIKRMRKKAYGINIISGPTGSGKSTTLQRALMALMKEKRNQVNLLTIEDPPEYVIKGAAQLPVLNAQTDSERNEKFRQAISAALRSDPDIVMIGEIRDQSSCKLAFTAAMTGHQVWASLHANDAISIIDRFRDQQVELYKLADHTLVTGLIGQRLIRRLCPHCRIPLQRACNEGLVTPELQDNVRKVAGEGRLHDIYVANPEGCDDAKCRSGYAGREVLAECIVPDTGFMRFVRSGDKEGAVDYWLKNLDGLTMLEHAIQKMLMGLCAPGDVEDKAGDLTDFNEERREIVFKKLFPKG